MSKKPIVTTIVTSAILGTAGAMTFMLPETLTASTAVAFTPPDEIVLNGVVRDFSRSHVDFDVTPSAGLGHYAGNVNVWLEGNRYPLFVPGEGYKVSGQWTDEDGHNIAPNMAGVVAGLTRETLGLRVAGDVDLSDDTMIDAFNSNYGPYGLMGNYGLAAFMSTNSTTGDSVKIGKKAFIRGDISVGPGGSPADVIENNGIITGAQRVLPEAYSMPDLLLPDDLEPFVVNRSYNNTSVTLVGDIDPDDGIVEPALHFGTLHFRRAVLTIQGDLRIRVDGDLTFDDTQLLLDPNADVTFYVSGDCTVKDQSLLNVSPGDTTRVTFNVPGTDELKLEKKSHVYATIIAPDRELEIKDEAHFYGGYVGNALKIDKKGSALHVDRGNASPGMWNFALTVREEIEVDDNALIDSFDSNDGPYGGANVGGDAWISTNETRDNKAKVKGDSTVEGNILVGPNSDPDEVTDISGGGVVSGSVGNLAVPLAIPVVAPPPIGASVGDIEYDGGTHVAASDFRCKKLKLKNGAELIIVGNRTIRIDDKLELDDGSRITLDEDSGSSLVVYIEKEATLDHGSSINMDTQNPQLVSMRFISVGSDTKLELKHSSQVCAWAQGGKTELKVEDDSEFFGSFTGRKAKIKKNSKMHVDMAYRTQCADVNDSAGADGSTSDGAIDSVASFGEWYRSVLGANQTMGHPITLTKDFFGVYEYLDDAFHPIDDKLMGNEGDAHNHYFTYTVGASFVYDECEGQFVEFEGGDGAWLFINGQLVLDIGGAGTSVGQYIGMDRLGLEDEQQYEFRLFYAQRREQTESFRLRTNLELSSEDAIPSITAMFD